MTRTLRPFAVTATALVLGAGLALGAALPAMGDTPPSDAVIDQQQTGAGSFAGSIPTNGQTFTAGSTGLLTSVHLILSSGPAGPHTIDLYAVGSNGLPTGGVLASAPFVGGSIPDDLANFTAPVAITAGSVYAVVWGDFLGSGTSGDSYSGGTALATAGGVLATEASDYAFATYVVPTATAASTTATVKTGDTVSIPLAVSTGATVAAATAPTHGLVAYSGTTATYTPVAGFVGTDTFTYTASNRAGTSAPATVTVTVAPLADPATSSPSSSSVLAATGVDSAWLIWPALGLLALGVIVIGLTRVVRRGRRRA